MRNFKVLMLSIVCLAASIAGAGQRHVLAVVEQANGSVGFYDSKSFARLGQVKVGHNPHEIAVSNDGRTAYVTNFGIQDYDETIGRPGHTVSIIDIRAVVEIRRLSTLPDKAPHGVKLRPTAESELFVNTEQPARMVVFDADTGQIKRRFNIDPKAHNFVFSLDGSVLWVMAGPKGIQAVDPDDGRVLAEHRMASPVRGLALSTDGKTLVASGKDEIELLDPNTLNVRKRLSGFGVGQILYAVPSPDNRYIVAPAVWDSAALIIGMETGEIIRRVVSGLDPVAVAYSPDGSIAYVSNARDTGVTTIDLKTLKSSRIDTGDGPNGLATSAVFRDFSARQRLLFGAVLPLSGRDATFGREMMLGYEFWKRDVNAKGGLYAGERSYEVDIDYLDSNSDDAQVEALSESLIAGGARFLLGPYGTPANAAMARVAERRHIPMVTSAGAARSLYQQGYRYPFGIMAPASEYLVGTINVALTQTPGPHRAAILTSDAPAPLEDARNAANHARRRGLAQASLPPDVLALASLAQDASGALVYANGRQNFDTVIQAFIDSGVDLLVMAGGMADSMAIVKASKAHAFHPMGLAFSVGPSVPLFATPMGLGNDAQHLIGSTQWSPRAPTRGHDRYTTAENFSESFWNQFFARPSYLSAGAYATGLVYEDAIVRGAEPTAASVRAALASTNLQTFYGPIDFNGNGLNENKPIYTIQLMFEGTRVFERLLAPLGENTEDPIWPFPGWTR